MGEGRGRHGLFRFGAFGSGPRSSPIDQCSDVAPEQLARSHCLPVMRHASPFAVAGVAATAIGLFAFYLEMPD
jgi:hypothetical protein